MLKRWVSDVPGCVCCCGRLPTRTLHLENFPRRGFGAPWSSVSCRSEESCSTWHQGGIWDWLHPLLSLLPPRALTPGTRFFNFLIYVYISYHIKQVRRFKNSNLFITGLLGKTCSEWFAGSCLPWCWPREAHGSSANGLTLLLLFPSSSTSLYILMVYICYWTDCTRWT